MPATMTDALLSNVTNIAAGATSQLANIPVGGQLGIGAQLPLIDAATPQVFTPVVAIVTHVPTLFKHIKNADTILKSLIERHAKSITGIDFGYTLEGANTPIGHDGQELSMPTNSKRTAVSPSFVFQEVQGNLVWNFFRMWISMIRHPDTDVSSLSAILNSEKFSPAVFSSFTMDMAILQFDPTGQSDNLVDCALYTNMWPQETGMFGLQREIGNTQLQERTIPFSAVVQHNANTFRVGQQLAESLNLHKANFDIAAPIGAAVENAIADMGRASEMSNIVEQTYTEL